MTTMPEYEAIYSLSIECERLRAENRRLATELANVSTQLDSARAQLSYYSRQER
jgi:hypothetical protein